MNALFERVANYCFGFDFFVSYSHADGKEYPRRLKQRLEESGFKVFLDQIEYAPGADLRRETRRQVLKSRHLVVVARDNALCSPWVFREVETFLQSGRIPILLDVNRSVEGVSEGSELAVMAQERHWLRLEELIDDPDGEPTAHAVSELVRSFGATRQETKRQRILAGTTAVFAVLAVAAGYMAWIAEQRRVLANDRLETTLETATRFVNQTVKMSDRFGVPRELVVELLKEPEQVFLTLMEENTGRLEVRRKYAQTLLDFSDNYEVLGDSELRLQRLQAAEKILAELVHKDPEQLDWQFVLANAHSKTGTTHLFRGDKAAAEAKYQQSLDIRRNLAEARPEDRKFQRYYSVALNRMGEISISRGRYPQAREFIGQAKDIRTRLLAGKPGDAGLKRDLFVCQIWMGDSFKAEKNFSSARAEYEVARKWAKEIWQQKQSSRRATRDLTVSMNKIGETLLGEGNTKAAKALYEEALPLRVKLVQTDESDRGAKRDLFVSYIQLGNVSLFDKDVDASRKYFRKALDISAALVDADPNYGHWQVDKAEALGWLGTVAETGGVEMLRKAIAELEMFKKTEKLPADRENLIPQFKAMLDVRATANN